MPTLQVILSSFLHTRFFPVSRVHKTDHTVMQLCMYNLLWTFFVFTFISNNVL